MADRAGWGASTRSTTTQIDKPTTRNSSGALYDLYPPEPKGMLRPAGEFNDSRIVVQGPKIEHWLNGVKIVSADMSSDDWKREDQRQQIQERQRLHEEAEGTHRAAGSSQPRVVPQHRADAAGFEGVETGKWWAAVTSTKLAKASAGVVSAWAFVGALATARARGGNESANRRAVAGCLAARAPAHRFAHARRRIARAV